MGIPPASPQANAGASACPPPAVFVSKPCSFPSVSRANTPAHKRSPRPPRERQSPSTAQWSPEQSSPASTARFPATAQYQQYQQPIPSASAVSEMRDMTMPKGRGQVRFTDVAAMIDPTTVSFTSLTDPSGTSVLDQNYQFDLVSNDRLLEKFIDKPITVTVVRGNKSEEVSGTLMSSEGAALVPRHKGRTAYRGRVNGYAGLSLPSLPGGPDHRPDARLGYQRSESRPPASPRGLPDRGHHLAGRLATSPTTKKTPTAARSTSGPGFPQS